MDVQCFDESLFDFPALQGSLYNTDENVEDEMLDDAYDPDLDFWDTQSDMILATTDAGHEQTMLEEFKDDDVKSNHQIEGHGATQIVKDRNWVISHIEEVFEKILDGLINHEKDLAITLKSRSSTLRRKSAAPLQTGEVPLSMTREITFPGTNVREAWRFTVLIRILELVHSCLVDDIIITKRDLYYRHPDLFVKQSVVDQYVDDLAYTFGISRSLLNVSAAAKGLIAGKFIMCREDGTSIDGLSQREGILVPAIQDTDALDLSSTRWILVIEKEATFRSLLSSPCWMRLGMQCLMVTAKGYPDLSSRKFLQRIANSSPYIPMFALVDFDPDGIAIMSTYKYGSYRLAHENISSNGTPALKLTQLRWLGVQSHQIGRTPVTERHTSNEPIYDAQGLMRLTSRDRRKACQMLEWDVCAIDGAEPAWRCELQTMLILNIKAELQVLEEYPGGLAFWLESRLQLVMGT